MARGLLLLAAPGRYSPQEGQGPELISYIQLSNVRGMGFPSFRFLLNARMSTVLLVINSASRPTKRSGDLPREEPATGLHP